MKDFWSNVLTIAYWFVMVYVAYLAIQALHAAASIAKSLKSIVAILKEWDSEDRDG